MRHVDQISLVDLRDAIRMQAISVFLNGRTSDEKPFEVSLSPQEVQLFTGHQE